MDCNESHGFDVIIESGGDDAFKKFSDVTEEADGAVAGDIVGVLSGFVNHSDKCGFPGGGEVSGGEAGAEELSQVLKVGDGCLF